MEMEPVSYTHLGEGQLRRHFLDMGLIQGTDIQYIKAAPMGDPIEYKIWGYELTLRQDDAKCIDIELQENKEKKKESSDVKLSLIHILYLWGGIETVS